MRQGLQAGEVKPTRSKVAIPSLNIGLTDREMEALALICKGYNAAKIAEELFINYRTVEGLRKNLLEKTGASNSVSLAIFAVKYQLLDF